LQHRRLSGGHVAVLRKPRLTPQAPQEARPAPAALRSGRRVSASRSPRHAAKIVRHVSRCMETWMISHPHLRLESGAAGAVHRAVPCSRRSQRTPLNRPRGTPSPPHSACNTRAGAPIFAGESDMTDHVSANAARTKRKQDGSASRAGDQRTERQKRFDRDLAALRALLSEGLQQSKSPPLAANDDAGEQPQALEPDSPKARLRPPSRARTAAKKA